MATIIQITGLVFLLALFFPKLRPSLAKVLELCIKILVEILQGLMKLLIELAKGLFKLLHIILKSILE